MFEAEILIPLADNAGKAFDPKRFETFERKAARFFGGATRLEGPTNGVWLDGKRLYRDELVRYVIALGSIGQGGDAVKLARFAKVHFEQEAVYLRYLGHAEIIK